MTASPQATARAVSRARRGWLPAIVGMAAIGVAVHLALFLFLSVPLSEGPAAPPDQRFVGYYEKQGDDHRLLQEQAVLLDSKPLFMPTVWNVASSLQNIARLRDESELFARYQPVLRLRQEGWEPGPESLPSSTTSLAAVLEGQAAYPLRGFGERGDLNGREPLEPRVAAISFKNLGGGPNPGDRALPALPGAAPPERLWSPAVFVLLVDPRTGGGEPLRVASSGIAEWDRALNRYLASPAFRQRLAPGYYRVTVGP